MNTSVIRPISQLGAKNQKQNLRKKNATFLAFKRNAKTVSNCSEHIFEPIVDISTGSQDFNKSVDESTDAALNAYNGPRYPKGYKSSRENNLNAPDTTSAKEKYVFVIINNVASATVQDDALRILDIKSAISGSSSSLGNVSVQNVTFSADQVKDTISEVIENLPERQNIDLNSSETDLECFLVLNSAIPFYINDVRPGFKTTQRLNKNIPQSTRPVSKCDASNYPEESIISTLGNNNRYNTESRLAAAEAPVDKFKEELARCYLTSDEIDEQQKISVKSEKDIPEEDGYYILVLDSECDITEVTKSSDESDKDQRKENNDCSDIKEEFFPDTIERVDVEGCKKQYYCKKCEKYFNSLKLLIKHSRLKCCGNKNNEKRRLAKKRCRARGINSINQTMEDGKQPVGCKRTNTGDQSVTCENCNGVFKNKKTLKQHIVTVCKNKEATGNDNNNIVCDICGKVYYKTSQFQAHMLSHENLRPFKCSECKSGFNSRWFLKRHIAQVHRKTRYMYFCSYCGLKSESKEHIEMHEQVHTLPEGVEVPQPYRCVCGKSFISKHSFRCHKYSCSSHGKVRIEMSLKCPLCGKVLATALSLNIHMEAKHNVNPTRGERAINCDLCDKKYSWFGSYVRHKLLTHKAEVTAREVEPYVGQPVSEEFFEVRPFQPRPRSQKQPKEPTGPHVCDVCNKECKNEGALRAHKWYHHNEKRKTQLKSNETVSCDLCHKTFSHKNSLTSHIHRYHRPRDPSQLTCHVCNKEFNNYGGLWTHNKYVHVDALPFDCAICGTKFKRKGDQTRHLKDKHGIIKPKESYDYDLKEEFDEVEEECDAEAVPGEVSSDLAGCSFETMNYSQ